MTTIEWAKLIREIKRKIVKQYTYAKCDVISILPYLENFDTKMFLEFSFKTQAKGDEISQFIVLLIGYRFEHFDSQPIDIVQRNFQLSRLANNLGFYFLSRDICQNTLNFIGKYNEVSSDLVRSILLVKARAFRGLGEYNRAIEVYGNLLLKQSNNEELEKAYLLLYMGKTAHNHLWRAGFYKYLTQFATKRLELLKISESDPTSNLQKKYLAICLDSQAMIGYEVASYSPKSQYGVEFLREINQKWSKAIELMIFVGGDNSVLRIRMRQAFANFQYVGADDRKLHLATFRCALDELELDVNEKRGLAVRYGQYAEMLAKIGDFEAAKDYLRRSILLSEKYSDWRTLANNQLRYARLLIQINGCIEEIVMSLNNALDKLKNIEQLHPDIGFNIYIEFANVYQRASDYTKSLAYLNKASDILIELEERLISDHDILTSPNNYRDNGFAVLRNSNILTKEELLELQAALVIDYRLLSALQRKVLADIERLRPASTRHLLMQSQLKFMAEGTIMQRHRFKNSIEDWKDNLLEKLHNLSAKAKGTELGRELAGIIFNATETSHVIEKAVASLTQRSPADGISFTSINKTLRKISELSYLNYYDPHLSIQCDFLDENGFELECYPDNLEDALYNLVENAAQILRSLAQQPKHTIWLRSSWFESSKTADGQGIIEIEDDAGKYEEFNLKWQSLISERNGGLKYTSTFFQRFDGQMELVKSIHDNTVIRITVCGGGVVRKRLQ